MENEKEVQEEELVECKECKTKLKEDEAQFSWFSKVYYCDFCYDEITKILRGNF